MRLVVADTGPLNCLVLIGAVDVVPKLFDMKYNSALGLCVLAIRAA
jgi:hypothetical protein